MDDGQTVYIDFFSSDIDRNIYQVTHQVTMDKDHKDDVVYKNRYDVTVLINGLPVVQIELKRPGVEINEAINQINRYRKFSFKGLFRYLQLFVVSNSVQTKYFCNENEMMNGQYNPILKSLVFFWTDENNARINDLNRFTGEFFRKAALTEMIDKYMVIKTTEPILMVMRPYQIYAVKAARKRVMEVNQNGYVFACTGSGKTLTSFKLAQLLRDEPMIDLVVFLIDRKDLDDQTVDEYNSFEKDCVDNTDSTRVLINMLKSSEKKMIVTTIQKMANAVKTPKYESVMDAYRDKKVVFIIDEGFKSWYLYYKDQQSSQNPKVPVPVDVDFDIELVRTDRINVVYILNLLKKAQTAQKSEEEKQKDIDLILREIERSDNESLRLKKDVMKQFILTRFYELPDDVDIMAAFDQFEKEQLQADMEAFAFDNNIDYEIVSELFSAYAFGGSISDEDVRQRLTQYKLGLLKLTKLSGNIKSFVKETYHKYRAEGE